MPHPVFRGTFAGEHRSTCQVYVDGCHHVAHDRSIRLRLMFGCSDRSGDLDSLYPLAKTHSTQFKSPSDVVVAGVGGAVQITNERPQIAGPLTGKYVVDKIKPSHRGHSSQLLRDASCSMAQVADISKQNRSYRMFRSDIPSRNQSEHANVRSEQASDAIPITTKHPKFYVSLCLKDSSTFWTVAGPPDAISVGHAERRDLGGDDTLCRRNPSQARFG